MLVFPQDHIKLGIQKYENTLALGIMPTFNIDGGFGIFTATMTVRWETTEGVEMIEQSARLAHEDLSLIASMWFVNTNTTTNGTYSYKTISISGFFYESDIEMPENQLTPIILIDFVNDNESCVTFEVADDEFQEENGVSILSQRIWWCSLLYPPMNFPSGFGQPDATFPSFSENRYVEGHSSVQDGDCISLSIENLVGPYSPVLFIWSDGNMTAFNSGNEIAYVLISDASGRIIEERYLRGQERILLKNEAGLRFARIFQNGMTYGVVVPFLD